MRTLPVVLGAAFMILASAALGQDQDREARIAKLIQDLAADDFKTREAADQELRRIGAPAIPALRRALEDKDAERADRARKVLAEVEKQAAKPEEKKGARPGIRVSSRDLARGVTFDMYPDGRVELTVPEEDKETGRKVYRTYKADSLDAFKEKHPEVAKKYNVDRFVPRVEWRPVDPEQFDKWWQDFKKRFDEDWFGDREEWFKDWRSPFDEDLDKWLEEQRKFFEDFRKRFRRGEPPEEPSEEPKEKRTPSGGGEFGIKVEPVSETLAAQLDLKEGEGVQVSDVKAGSLAERAGLKKHDVILKLNGRTVADKWEFRKSVRATLGAEFELEIVRGGKRETVKVKPAKEE